MLTKNAATNAQDILEKANIGRILAGFYTRWAAMAARVSPGKS